MGKHTLEDFAVGQRFESADRITLDADAIVEFARRYDPQPFHTDPEAAKSTFFGQHVASGWHTASVSMRLMTSCGIESAWGLVGREVLSLGWPRPVKPGDTLRLAIEVVEIRPSRSRPELGSVTARMDTINQNDEIVQTMLCVMIVPTRAGVAVA